MEKVEKCSFCGEVMEKGFLIGGRGIYWWPNKPLPRWNCKGDDIAPSANVWQWGCPHLPAYRCKNYPDTILGRKINCCPKPKIWIQLYCCCIQHKITDNKFLITVNGATYMHGKHSWRVEGSSSQDTMISQLLSREAVEYIRNRKDNQKRGVCFSFWYNISTLVSDDIIVSVNSGQRNRAFLPPLSAR